MRRALLVIGFSLVLASCAVRPAPQENSSSSSSSSLVEAPAALAVGEEIGGQGEAAPTTEESTGTGALPERLLSSGVLAIGSERAPLTLLLFTEHNCSYCREFQTELFPRLATEYIAPGKLTLQIAILPLKKYDRSADEAAAFLCAAKQGKGLPMHEMLLQTYLKPNAAIAGSAKALHLDAKVFESCLKSTETGNIFEAQSAWLKSLDITLVPTFLLNGEKAVGLPTYADLRGRIEEALKEVRGNE